MKQAHHYLLAQTEITSSPTRYKVLYKHFQPRNTPFRLASAIGALLHFISKFSPPTALYSATQNDHRSSPSHRSFAPRYVYLIFQFGQTGGNRAQIFRRDAGRAIIKRSEVSYLLYRYSVHGVLGPNNRSANSLSSIAAVAFTINRYIVVPNFDGVSLLIVPYRQHTIDWACSIHASLIRCLIPIKKGEVR